MAGVSSKRDQTVNHSPILNAIETCVLVKKYGKVTAVDRLSLQVKRGEIYAFLGLNGSGKTTTIRLLLGMVKPTAGEVSVLGCKILPGEKKPWDAVGYLVETADAYPELTVRENLEAMRRLRPGCPPQAVSGIIERLDLAEYAGRKTSTLSHGNAQRLGLAKALLHQPKLLILDEPANGLDPAGIVEIRNLLHELVKEQGVTVFMSSHILAEVARLAQRIGIIHQGRLLQEMDVDELERQRRERLLLRTRDLPATLTALANAGFSAKTIENNTIEVAEKIAIEQPDQIARLLVEAGLPPLMLHVEQEELEDYFLRLVGMPGGEA
jgi:ABC-2 type transport system ATP-binding protein